MFLQLLCLQTTTTFKRLQSIGVFIKVNHLNFLKFIFSPFFSSHALPQFFFQIFHKLFFNLHDDFASFFRKSPIFSTKAPSSSHAQALDLSSSKLIPSKYTPSLFPRDEIIDLLPAIEADQVLAKRSLSSVWADLNPSTSTLGVQVPMERKKKAKSAREAFNMRQWQENKLRGNPPEPAPLPQSALSPSTRMLPVRDVNTIAAQHVQETLTWLWLPAFGVSLHVTWHLFERSAELLRDVVISNLFYNSTNLICRFVWKLKGFCWISLQIL